MTATLPLVNGQESAEVIHLFTELKGDRVDPCVPIRWCASKQVVESVKTSTDIAYILLVISQNGREVERHYFLFTEEMGYIAFDRPGEHEISATIVLTDNFNRMLDALAEKKGGCYSEQLLGHRGVLRDNLRYVRGINRQLGMGVLQVNVAGEFFSHKPPAWLWAWGNLWYECDAKDSCQFRRRLMVAFTIQPLVVLYWVVSSCIARFLCAATLRYGCGIRGIDFAPILHPLRDDFKEVWYGWSTSVFWHKKDGQPQSWFCLFFMPVVVLPALGTSMLVAYFLSGDEAEGSTVFLNGLTGYLGCMIGLSLLWLLLEIVERRFPEASASLRSFGGISTWMEERREQQKLLKAQQEDALYASMVCDGTSRSVAVVDLPAPKRKIWLWYADFKRKVCKPYPKK